MNSHQVTIKDIARELGLSPSTVSRALKDHPDISSKTKQEVVNLANKLNYRPNVIALSLRSKKTNIIGLIVPQVVHYFFSTIISGIEDVANSAGYNVMICQSNEIYKKEVANTQTLMASRIDGLLVSVTKETINSEHFAELIKNGIPVIFFDRICQDIKTDKVIVDDHDGAFKAVEYLISTGCKRIVHFAGPKNRLIGMNRLNGYLHALEKYSIPIDKKLIVYCDTFKQAQKVVPGLLSINNPPDGIFAVNDLTAIGAIKKIKETGLKIPDDISVVGFGDSLYSIISDPELTTVRQPGYEIGQTAANLLINRLENSELQKKPEFKVLKTSLIIRKSTKRKL
ncbi:MAG: LacI family DNA-binding transcriptional regulator [Bacteroidales bacterium]|nr:LacI family DNA-binding transcriptional regulator [Bacteroidales bacterium]